MPKRTKELILATQDHIRRLGQSNDSFDLVKVILMEHLELELEELHRQYEQETGYALDTGDLSQPPQQEAISLPIIESSEDSERSPSGGA